MGAAMPILMGVQAIAKLAGANQDYHNQKKMLQQQQAAAQQNAQIEGIKASQTADIYAQKQKQADDQMRLIRGHIAASAGASGLENAGSASDALAASEEAYIQDSKTILQNQRNATWGYMVNQANYENDAKGYKNMIKQAKQQRNASYFNTLIGAASQAYNMGMFSKSNAGNDWLRLGDVQKDWTYNAGSGNGFMRTGNVKNGWTYYG